jgi:VanZ family protein
MLLLTSHWLDNMKKHNWIRYRLFAIAYLILISILFLLPGSSLPKENWFKTIYLDKWIHIILFAILIILWLKAFPGYSSRLYILLMVSAILYGILIELSQELFVLNRSMDVFDILADTAGVIAGAWYVGLYKKNKPL